MKASLLIGAHPADELELIDLGDGKFMLTHPSLDLIKRGFVLTDSRNVDIVVDMELPDHSKSG